MLRGEFCRAKLSVCGYTAMLTKPLGNTITQSDTCISLPPQGETGFSLIHFKDTYMWMHIGSLLVVYEVDLKPNCCMFCIGSMFYTFFASYESTYNVSLDHTKIVFTNIVKSNIVLEIFKFD